LKKETNAILIIFLFFILFSAGYAFAFEGLTFDTKYLHPGKLDFHYQHTEATDEDNLIWWSPVFKGGWGIIDYDAGPHTEYSGGYFRPLIPEDGRGELILGFLQLNTATRYSYEFQGEYRLPCGLGLGGGYVAAANGDSDIEFAKISYRNKFSEWNYIVETQFQETSDEASGGGYLAVFNDLLMLTYGNDGEQWRTAIAYIARENESILRPCFEVLYIDNEIGSVDGSKRLFINVTLRYKGGFLSHEARLGRAMGPTGLEFGNPLGFLATTWNRKLDVWELGDLVDFRFDRIKAPSGTTTERYEALIYPFQFDKKVNLWDYFYCGGFNSRVSGESSAGPMLGVFGKLGFLRLGLGAAYNTDTHERRIYFGCIDNF
jgi:hypothetical protein